MYCSLGQGFTILFDYVVKVRIFFIHSGDDCKELVQRAVLVGTRFKSWHLHFLSVAVSAARMRQAFLNDRLNLAHIIF